MGHSRTFRIFVSSTFSDLKAERNALQERVFPALQQLCEARGCRFQAIDLRWGVSEEAALDQQTMNICLTELKRCQDATPRPNFLILLGDRYGWLPPPPQIEAGEFETILTRVTDPDAQALLADWYRLDTNAVPPEYVLRPRRAELPEEAEYDAWGETEAQLRGILLAAIDELGWLLNDPRHIKYECSATHQEIIEGALKLPDEREHVFAFFRNICNLDELPADSVYADVGTTKVQELKRAIADTPGVTTFPYDVTWNGRDIDAHLEQFAADALQSLTRIIEEEFAQLDNLDPLTREEIAHLEFATERRRHFVGRQRMLFDIAAYLAGEDRAPLVIYGPSGTGKSALLAQAAAQATGTHRTAHIIQRYIGATPESTEIRGLLENLFREITRAYGGDAEGIASEYKDLSNQFPVLLAAATAERPLILFIDALDQLSATDNAHALSWLPRELPPHVRVVVSVLEREDDAGLCLRAARAKYPAQALLPLGEMTSEEGTAALQAWLRGARRTLTAVQLANVQTGFRGCPTPLYLKLAFEEARRWKSYDGLPCGADDVPGLAGDVPGVVGDMLAWLRDRRQHGPVLVEAVLGLLSAARHGLSETEILELLTGDVQVMADLRARSTRSPEAAEIPVIVWLRLYYDLAPYLMERAADHTVLYNFYHRIVGETIQRDYLNTERHACLAHYFGDQLLWVSESPRVPNYRKCTELPYQQTESEMWDGLVATLTELDFVDAKSKAGMVYDLVADYNRAERALPEGQEERHKEEERQKRIKDYVDKLIAHSSDPDHVPLPDPPETVPFIPVWSAGERHGDWTPLERVKAWRHFTNMHIQQLADGREPVYQLAWNSSDAGPIAEQLNEMERNGLGFSGEWLRLQNRMTFITNPACLKTLKGHLGNISTVAITQDGLYAVSGSGDIHATDTTLRKWNLETGESLLMEGHTDRITALSITSDSRLAVSGSLDSTLRVWDLMTGECRRTLRGHIGYVMAVAITPDGRRAISGSTDNTLRVWDLETGASRVLLGHTHGVWAVAITPDGCRAVSGGGDPWKGSDFALRIWDIETGTSQVLNGHTNRINVVSLTPNGRRAVSGSLDYTLRVWNLETGESQELAGHTDSITSVSITPDGHRAVSGSEGDDLRLWDMETGVSRVLEGHTGRARVVAITPDGRRAVSGSWDRTLRVWDLETCTSRVLEGHTDRVNIVSITPDGRRAVSGSEDKTVCLWDLERGETRPLKGHTGWVKAVSIMPDGSHAVSGADDKAFRMWNLETGASQVLDGERGGIHALSITPDCRHVVSGDGALYGEYDYYLRVWDLTTGESRARAGHTEPIDAVLITPDGSRAVTGSGDHSLRVWNLETGESRALDGYYTPYLDGLSITLDGRKVVSGSTDKTLRVWDLETGELRVLEGHEGGVYSNTVKAISITPDGRCVVSGSDDHTLRLWNIKTGVSQALKGHTDWVRAIAITPDGRRVVSGSHDKTLRVWNLETGASRVLEGHTEIVWTVSITPDSRRAVSGSHDETFRVWNLETCECVAVYEIDHSATTVAIHGPRLIVGKVSGLVDVLTIGNYHIGRPFITATRLWLFDHNSWATNITAQCYWCGKRFLVINDWIGQEIACPLNGCGKPLKLNPFVCDNSDWL